MGTEPALHTAEDASPPELWRASWKLLLMLAALGFMGLRNIHRMNGLKNWGGLCMNGVAATMFASSSLVSWPVALAMAVGAVSGGYLGSRTAQKVPQQVVRNAVVAIGLISGVLLFLTR